MILTEKEVDDLLDMPSTLEAVLRQHVEGRATNGVRRRVALPRSGLNFMAAGGRAVCDRAVEQDIRRNIEL